MNYNVEALFPPVADDDWDNLRDLIDIIPGTLLIEDPDEPLLIFPVEAVDEDAAFNLVDGWLKLRGGAMPLRGSICRVEDDRCVDEHCDDDRAAEDWQDLVSS